jgi:hypothetical protein
MLEKNSIKKIILDFEYKGRHGDAFLTTGETSNYFYEVLLPVVNRLIEQKSPEQAISIERLEIDLGTLSMADLPGMIEAELMRQLDSCLTIEAGSEDVVNTGLRTLVIMLNDALYFLSYGVFPWHYDIVNGGFNNLMALLLKEDKVLTIEALTKLLATYPASLQRFVWQVNSTHLKTVFKLLVANSQYALLLQQWYTYIAKHKTTAIHDAFIRLFTFVLTVNLNSDEEDFLKKISVSVIVPYFTLPEHFLPNLVAYMAITWKKALRVQQISNITVANSNVLFPALAHWLEAELKNDSAKDKSKSKSVENKGEATTKPADAIADIPGDVYINNAGLVILNPYLQMFFSRMNLTNDEGFLDLQAQQKATQLLHYLATGSLTTPEQLLPLCKIICGLDVHMPVPAKLKLTKEEKEACNVLLQAVINNWARIKSTSVDGLRGTFLLRDGILRKDETNWLLHVERKTVDVLVDDLPWQFRLLKFPWNEYIVHVQW